MAWQTNTDSMRLESGDDLRGLGLTSGKQCSDFVVTGVAASTGSTSFGHFAN